MKPPNLEVHIEQLIVEGFPDINRHQLGESVKQELERHFAEHGIPTSLSRNQVLAKVSPNTINVASNSNDRTLGTQIAKAIHGGLKS